MYLIVFIRLLEWFMIRCIYMAQIKYDFQVVGNQHTIISQSHSTQFSKFNLAKLYIEII